MKRIAKNGLITLVALSVCTVGYTLAEKLSKKKRTIEINLDENKQN